MAMVQIQVATESGWQTKLEIELPSVPGIDEHIFISDGVIKNLYRVKRVIHETRLGSLVSIQLRVVPDNPANED